MGLRQNKVTIYRFKRLFGRALTFLILETNSHNVRTGAIARTYTQINIKRAVILPPTLDRSFVYDLAYIAAGKNFTEGGFFDRTQTMILIALKDLPKTFVPKIKNHVEFDGGRHEIRTVTTYPETASMILTTINISNSETVGV